MFLSIYSSISCIANKLVHVITYGKNILEVLQNIILLITIEILY